MGEHQSNKAANKRKKYKLTNLLTFTVLLHPRFHAERQKNSVKWFPCHFDFLLCRVGYWSFCGLCDILMFLCSFYCSKTQNSFIVNSQYKKASGCMKFSSVKGCIVNTLQSSTSQLFLSNWTSFKALLISNSFKTNEFGHFFVCQHVKCSGLDTVQIQPHGRMFRLHKVIKSNITIVRKMFTNGKYDKMEL